MPFKIVQTIDKGKFVLSIVPYTWEKDGTLYWPRKNVDILKKFDQSEPDDNWLTFGCILKQTNLATYQKAEYEISKKHLHSKDEANNGEANLKSRGAVSQMQIFDDDSENDSGSMSYPIISKTENSHEIDFDYEIVTEDNTGFNKQELYSAAASSQADVLLSKMNAILKSNMRIQKNIADIQRNLKLLNERQKIIFSNLDQICTQSDSRSEKPNIDIEIIKNIEDFDNLENLLKNPDNEKELTKKYSVICGVGKGRGVNNAYELIDAIFDRHFLPECSWAGGSKTGESKICFKSYTHVINFFFNLVHMSDSSYTLTDCHDFFKTVLRNSRQRCASKHMRKSAAKNRQKRKQLIGSTDPLDVMEPNPESYMDQEEQVNQSTDEDL